MNIEPQVPDNPFRVFSPEYMTSRDVVDLFVVKSPGADAIRSDGHSMLVGSRGAGKSMLLRYLEPDCQLLAKSMQSSALKLADIPFYTAYVSIKAIETNRPGFKAIEGSHASHVLNEHFLVIAIALSFVERAIRNNHFSGTDLNFTPSLRGDLDELMISLSDDSTSYQNSDVATLTEESFLRTLSKFLKTKYSEMVDYLDSIVDAQRLPAFKQKVYRYTNLLEPLIFSFKKFPSMPASKKFFLAIDDADQMSEVQTTILNTWLSRRNSDFSFKVAYEMYGYKTFYTTTESRIESAHDYQEIKISDVYTSNHKLNYKDRLREIVRLRLLRSGIGRSKAMIPDVLGFFPTDHSQKIRIAKLEDRLRRELSGSGSRSARQRDDIYRYLMPTYISELGGTRKSRSKYLYSGFDQLADLSSGTPRYFLEAAQKMYDRQLVKSTPKPVSEISPDVQNSIVRDLASELYLGELEKLRLDQKNDELSNFAVMLQNLISCLGSLFEVILTNPKASERRVFSFAISDYPDEQVQSVLRLGLKYGYFSRSTIGRKEGFGRTELYVLSRRLAPNWNLDPSGFSAYKFLLNSELQLMMKKPNEFRNQLRRSKGRNSVDALQLDLLDEEEANA